MSKWVIGILLLFVGESLFAQNNNKGKVSGVVIDSNDKSPVIQATVQILSLRDSSMIAGNKLGWTFFNTCAYWKISIESFLYWL